MNWLITGGCGFIGAALVRSLWLEGGHRIRVLDNLSTGTREDLAAVCDFAEVSPNCALQAGGGTDLVELVVADVLDEQSVLDAARGVDVIVHLAANTGVAPSVEDPRADCMTNVVGTLNCLEAARRNGVGRFVFASSGAPVGECEPPIHEEKVPRPVSPYGASKLAGEAYCSAYSRTFGIDTVVLRFGNVYGPGSGHKSSVVAKFIKQAFAGEPLEIYGDGGQTRDFIYIDDLVQAIRLAAREAGVGGEVFQIATSRETSVNELVTALVEVLREKGIEPPPVRHGDTRPGDVRRNYSDTTKAKHILGWTVSTSLDTGLRRTVNWFLDCEASRGKRRA